MVDTWIQEGERSLGTVVLALFKIMGRECSLELRFRRRLSLWRRQERVTLIKITRSNLPIYMMSLFPKRLENIQRDFF